jgi:hypothetical protein
MCTFSTNSSQNTTEINFVACAKRQVWLLTHNNPLSIHCILDFYPFKIKNR